MKILQISDIHFNYKNFKSNVLRNRLLKYVKENNIEVDAMIITGDCVYQYGKTKECENFLEELSTKIKCAKENIFICPGNHDLDRYNAKRNDRINTIRKENIDITDKEYFELIEDGYDRFFAFHKNVTGREYEDFSVIERTVGENKYRIFTVNTCLLSKDNQDEGTLRVCCNKLESMFYTQHNDESINILIMHHGIEYLKEEEILQFQHWIDDNYIDMVLCGHSHRGGIYILSETVFEIKQFVCGATMLDNYTIPSFIIYDINMSEAYVNVELYSFINDEWSLGSSYLRVFKNGKYQYKLIRLKKLKQKKSFEKSPKISKIISSQESGVKNSLEKLNAAEMAFLNELDEKVFNEYGRKIWSSKYGCQEEFSTEKIICSLLNIGIPYEKVLRITETVVNTIVSNQYKSDNFGELTTEKIRDEIYYTICQTCFEKNNKFDINEWAGKYARRYGHNSSILKIVDPDGKKQSISIKFISDWIIRDMFFRVTGDNNCYESLLRTEINKIALDIMSFLKECNAYYLEYEKLLMFLMEMASQEPHPYIILESRKESILKYHETKVNKHLRKIKDKKAEHITIIEALYHASALLVSIYSNVTGFAETSPITILNMSISGFGIEDKKTPISKLRMIDLKKDIGSSGVYWSDFVYLVYDITSSDIMKNMLIEQDNEIVSKIVSFSEIVLKVYETYKNKNISLLGSVPNVLSFVLSKGEGFVVKSPLKKQTNCFWLTTKWKAEEKLIYDLKEQILFVVMEDLQDDLNKVQHYLKEKKDNCRDSIWIKMNCNVFENEEKELIQTQMKQINIKAYFIDNTIIEKWNRTNVRKAIFEMLID